MSDGRRVLVIGGGLAGIAAALDCSAEGARVTLLEVRRRLGGAVYSFERDGLQIDNGQHVFMRCCVAYRGLLERIGSTGQVSVQRRLRVPVLSPGARPALLRRRALPAPLHMAEALARYPHLTFAQRLGAARAALAVRRLNLRDLREEALGGATFGAWLERHGQSPEAVDALWDVIVRPTLNLPAAEASPALGAFVFRTALLSAADAGDIGFHIAPLSEIVGVPAERALRRAGVEVRLGWRAERLERVATGIRVYGRGSDAQARERDAGGGSDGDAGGGSEGRARVGSDGDAGGGYDGGARVGSGGDASDGDARKRDARELEELSADVAIVALPHNRAAGLLAPVLPEVAHRLGALGSSPIVNLHVVYDRPVCDEAFAAGVDTPVQYLFDRTHAGGVPAGCQYLAVSLSAAEHEMGMSPDALRERYLPALQQLLPRARGARVEYFLATREHAATFRAVPGVARLRAPARTTVPGLVLAGAWTDTGWPATLEGAVRSGHAAARIALADL